MAVTLLLVGRDGNGKSSTGNSVLDKRVFTPRSSSQTGPGEIVSKSSTIDGTDVTVVDGPGIGDTNVNDPDDVKLTLQNVEEAIKLCSNGFTALIIVFKYGVRFTKQEKDTVLMIKSIFGDNIFKDYGIIVMTYGDSFDLDNEEENTSFEDWCNDQTGDIKDLFEVCGNRRVLFNNRAKDEWSLRIQRDLLLSAVAKIQAVRHPYTWTDYTKAENGRNRMIVFSRKSQLEKESKQVLDDISKRIGRIDIRSNPGVAIDRIMDLQREIRRHKQHLEREAQNTDVMKDLLIQVRVLESNLETKEKLAITTQEMRNVQPPQNDTTVVMESNDDYMHDHRYNYRRDDYGYCYYCLMALREIVVCCGVGIVYLYRSIKRLIC